MYKFIIKLFVVQIVFLLLISCYASTPLSTQNKSVPLKPTPPVNNSYKTKPTLMPSKPQSSKHIHEYKLT